MLKKIGMIIFILLTSTVFGQNLKDAFQAVQNNQIEKISEFLKNNPQLLFQKDEKGRTLLHEAAYSGQKEIAGLLIENGAAINASDELGWTPLHESVMKENKEVAGILLEKGADSRAATKKERTPVHIAAMKGNLELLKLLQSYGADLREDDMDNWTALFFAAKNNNVEMIRYLISQGVPINAKDSRGRTPLHQASQEGHREAVTVLLGYGASPSAKDYSLSQPKTPVDVAKNEEITKILVDAGGEPAKSEYKDGFLFTPSFQYSSVINDMDILYYGMQLEWFTSYKLSFYWSYYMGSGEDDYTYLRFPGAALALHNLFTLWSTNYNRELRNESTLLYILMGLSAIIPEGISFHIHPYNYHWLDVAPYFGFASADVGWKDGKKTINVGAELGLKLNFIPVRRFFISPYFSLKLMYLDGDFGYNTGMNVGYLF